MPTPPPFYQRYDANTDGFHSKKEFYYAIMEDDFEALASKYDKVCCQDAQRVVIAPGRGETTLRVQVLTGATPA